MKQNYCVYYYFIVYLTQKECTFYTKTDAVLGIRPFLAGASYKVPNM